MSLQQNYAQDSGHEVFLQWENTFLSSPAKHQVNTLNTDNLPLSQAAQLLTWL